MAEFDEELFEDSLCSESNEWTKDTLSGLPACKGVLLFVNTASRPIQLLQAANLRRTAQAKLVREETIAATRKTDISELTAKLFFVRCHNNFELQLAYVRLAHAVFKKNAGNWIQLPKPSFATINSEQPLPYFYVADISQTNETSQTFGLFPNRKTAALFCEILNTVFVLCRNPSLLNTGKEASCPYLQMETCPGPCLNMTIRENYAEAVRKACNTAAGHIQPAIEYFQEKMNQASRSTQFEQAASLKKKIESLSKLTAHDFCWAGHLEDLCILHIDLGAKRKIAGKNNKRRLYRAFKITAENVYELGTFVPKTPEQVMSFLTRTWSRDRKIVYTPKTKEHLATLSLFLFRSGRSGLWLDCSNGTEKDALMTQLHETLGISIPHKDA